MLIIAGFFEVDPDRRDEFLQSKHDSIRSSRAEAGCHEYALSADPLVPGRVLLYELWEDKPSLAAHITGLKSRPASAIPGVPVLRSEYLQYEIATTGPLGS